MFLSYDPYIPGAVGYVKHMSTTDLNLQYLNLNVFGSAPNQSCYQPSAGGLLELVLRPNLSIFAPGYFGTPPKARDELAENSGNFAFYESALPR